MPTKYDIEQQPKFQRDYAVGLITAKLLRNKCLSLDTISKITGIKVEKLQKYKEEIDNDETIKQTAGYREGIDEMIANLLKRTSLSHDAIAVLAEVTTTHVHTVKQTSL